MISAGLSFTLIACASYLRNRYKYSVFSSTNVQQIPKRRLRKRISDLHSTTLLFIVDAVGNSNVDVLEKGRNDVVDVEVVARARERQHVCPFHFHQCPTVPPSLLPAQGLRPHSTHRKIPARPKQSEPRGECQLPTLPMRPHYIRKGHSYPGADIT
jgi:hypothetical protein